MQAEMTVEKIATVFAVPTEWLEDSRTVAAAMNAYLAWSFLWRMDGEMFGESHENALALIERGTATWDSAIFDDDEDDW